MNSKDVLPEYVYHIKDSYFSKANDPKLMQNKEGGNYRPTFYCYKDCKTSLLWVVPLSSQVDKYQSIVNKNIEKYGTSIGIYIDKFDRKNTAFLIQNMFPITEQYIDHIHTRNGNPIPVKLNVIKEIKKRVKKALVLKAKGKKVVFPDIDRLEKLMLDELNQNKYDFSDTSFIVLKNKQEIDILEDNCIKFRVNKSKTAVQINKIDLDKAKLCLNTTAIINEVCTFEVTQHQLSKFVESGIPFICFDKNSHKYISVDRTNESEAKALLAKSIKKNNLHI